MSNKLAVKGIKTVVGALNSIGVFKIVNSGVNMVMPTAIKFPIRVCVRIATWGLSGVLETASNKYISETIDSVNDYVENHVHINIENQHDSSDSISEEPDGVNPVIVKIDEALMESLRRLEGLNEKNKTSDEQPESNGGNGDGQ